MMTARDGLVRDIRERYARARDLIEESAGRAGRTADSVRLVVVTKSQPISVVEAAIEAGARILGENYPEEALEKMDALRDAHLPAAVGASSAELEPPGTLSVEWHMIGHIQSRKAKLVAGRFALVHSVDSIKLAERLSGLAADLTLPVDVLLEFNVGGETGKTGWDAADEATWPRLLDEADAVANLPHLRVHGVMTMQPLSVNPEDSRPYFKKLVKLRDFLAARVQRADWRELSMGTSVDYAVAVEEGATLVRVGAAIVGARPAREPK